MLSSEGKRNLGDSLDFVKNLKAGQHGCMFFTERDDFKKLQFAFVKSGLDQGWGVVYASAVEPIDKVRTEMKGYGIDVQTSESDGNLILVRGEDLYKDAKKPDLRAWTEAAKSVCNAFIKSGKKGARVAADLSSYFFSRGLTRQWFELEYALEKKSALPLTVLCGYDTRNIAPSRDLDILEYYKLINREQKEYVDAHSFAIYTTSNKTMIMTI